MSDFELNNMASNMAVKYAEEIDQLKQQLEQSRAREAELVEYLAHIKLDSQNNNFQDIFELANEAINQRHKSYDHYKALKAIDKLDRLEVSDG